MNRETYPLNNQTPPAAPLHLPRRLLRPLRVRNVINRHVAALGRELLRHQRAETPMFKDSDVSRVVSKRMDGSGGVDTVRRR